MDKRAILAVAGAGKTYYICHSIDPQKKNLILAYTNENIRNIERELFDAHMGIPELTKVMTFDSFIYRFLLCPYEPSIGEYFGVLHFTSKGISMLEPPKQQITNALRQKVRNPYYITKDKIRHYITNNDQYYCATMSELVLQVKKGNKSFIKRACTRINLFFDYVLIDEFQDFRECDYELIIALAKHLNHLLLVGDYYQHSVCAVNNSGKPFKKKKGDISYLDFIAELDRNKFEIDTTTLNKSRRCSLKVCEFIKQKLNINISSYDNHEGDIIWIDETVKEILENDNILKLVYKNADKYSFKAMNWSYSKGDTVDEACVILTSNFEKLDNEFFSSQKLSISTINKLYVAMTRTRGNLYLIKSSTFKKVEKLYKVNN